MGKEDSERFDVSIYEVPPGKSAVPYHYHMRNEEVFYILSGTGLLKTPEGERQVTVGDFLYFPNNEKGAHKVTNISETEPLIYADFDIRHSLEVAVYPDSDKVGIYAKGNLMVFPTSKQVDYYEGELANIAWHIEGGEMCTPLGICFGKAPRIYVLIYIIIGAK